MESGSTYSFVSGFFHPYIYTHTQGGMHIHKHTHKMEQMEYYSAIKKSEISPFAIT